MRTPRPERPTLPRPEHAAIVVQGFILGKVLVAPATAEDEATLRRLDGQAAYVVAADDEEEMLIRLLGYVRALEAAPVWEATPPQR